MRRHIWLLFLLICIALITQPAFASRGIGINIATAEGERQVDLYQGSHALLVGVSDYRVGWPDLESVPSELDMLQHALEQKGFAVERVSDPDSESLSSSFEEFIDRYGYDEHNRLLFFFSGHGYSRKNGTKGYLVPADAPDPREDEKGFLRKAINMGQVLTWARQIESKHALFLFDSCFSGTVFKTKALPETPPHISEATTKPVRQFISAGSAGEEVPAKSVFVPTFLRALSGEGDLDRDGYVTGTELGMFLHNKVLAYDSHQTPQYGKIRDPELDEGDFVFLNETLQEALAEALKERQKEAKPDKGESERLFWESVRGGENPELFEAYLQSYPEGVFAPLAKARIEELRRKQAKAKGLVTREQDRQQQAEQKQAEEEHLFWESVRDSESPLLLQTYLASYPEGTFATLATVRIKELKNTLSRKQVDRRQQEETLYWQSIQNSTTPALFQAYLEKYPQGRFVGLARLKVEELARRKTVAGSGMAAVPKERVAILPFVNLTPPDWHDKAQRKVLSTALGFLEERDDLQLAASYYPVKEAKKGEQPALLDKSVRKRIWKKKGFMRGKELDAEAVAEICTPLGIDLALLYSFDANWIHTEVALYLVDVKTRKVYRKGVEANRMYPDGLQELMGMTKLLLTKRQKALESVEAN